MTEGATRIPWSQDEARALVAIYFGASFSIGDDARDECRIIADAFGRTPASVDRQWRNVQAVVNGNASYNIGQIIKLSVAEYLDNPKAMQQIAKQICIRREWGLDELIENGRLKKNDHSTESPSNDAPPSGELLNQLHAIIGALSSKVFKSGAVGFFSQGKVHDEAGEQYQAQFSAVLIGSKNQRSPDLLAPTHAAISLIENNLSHLRPKRFSSGRTGYFGNTKFQIADERFQLTMQVVHIRGVEA